MTRRTDNRQKFVAAARAARIADGWIGTSAQLASLAAAIGTSNAASHAATLLRHERVRRRFPAFAVALGDAIKAAPKLGRCLSSPDALHHLVLMTGAGLAGGAMTRVVGRPSVSALIDGLGQDVWAYGVEHGGVIDGASPHHPDDMIDLISDVGCNAVFAYLEETSHGLGVAAFDAAALPYDRKHPPQDSQNSRSAVQGAMERVTS